MKVANDYPIASTHNIVRANHKHIYKYLKDWWLRRILVLIKLLNEFSKIKILIDLIFKINDFHCQNGVFWTNIKLLNRGKLTSMKVWTY